LKKRTKNFANSASVSPGEPKPKEPKVFCFFFSKKKCFPACLCVLRRGATPTPALPQSGGGRSWAGTKSSKKLLSVWASALQETLAPKSQKFFGSFF
jgi:hypothetical protein